VEAEGMRLKVEALDGLRISRLSMYLLPAGEVEEKKEA
jgi:hypothetical protein